jgi:hypothetical protein
MPSPDETNSTARKALAYLLLLGLFLTLRGYRSREGDQAYRLPILIHSQDAGLYVHDPFVRAFDQFNPHRGYLALVGSTGDLVGLSAALACLFATTFLITCYGFDRLARTVSLGQGPFIDLVAVGLLLLSQAGNIGTNHLFEPLLLDRLIAFALGWVALAMAVEGSRAGSIGAVLSIGLAAFIHPSVGLQLALLLGVSRTIWLVLGLGRDMGYLGTFSWLLALGLAVLPGLGLNLQASARLLEGVDPDTVRLLGAELQSPQHMLPHLWGMPRWLAWGCYPMLAILALAAHRDPSEPRKRLAVLLGVNLLALLVAWLSIEVLGNVRIILFQPFRLATVARGVCLVFIAGHVLKLWTRGDRLGRIRATLLAVGLTGDWRLVVVTTFELAMSLADMVPALTARSWMRWASRASAWAILALGLVFLGRHDTESGHRALIVAALGTFIVGGRVASLSFPGPPLRQALRFAAAWALPLAALAANLAPGSSSLDGRSARGWLVRHCRFAEIPLDDIERLALWCRDHTPTDSRFIGPPGQKTFRLWSLRNLAFNRAGSPYEAAGLVDWARRFQEHVALDGTFTDLVRSYQGGRHALEARYDALSASRKAELATRQGASYVVALAPRGSGNENVGHLTLLHVEGRYGVYEVDRDAPAVAARAN